LQRVVSPPGKLTHQHGQFLAFTRRLETLIECFDRHWLQPSQQARPAHSQRLLALCRPAQGAQYVRRLFQLRHQLVQSATGLQYLDEHLRLTFHQRPFDLFPATFGCQRLQFARFGDLAHQRQCFIGDLEAQGGVTCGKAGNT